MRAVPFRELDTVAQMDHGYGNKIWIYYIFPDDKKKISKLSYENKMEWYATRKPEEMV